MGSGTGAGQPGPWLGALPPKTAEVGETAKQRAEAAAAVPAAGLCPGAGTLGSGHRAGGHATSSVLGAGLQPGAPSLEDVCWRVSATPTAHHPSRPGRADVASLRRAGEGWQETAAPPAPRPPGRAGAGSALTYRPSRKKGKKQERGDGRGVAVKCARGSSCRAGGAMPISCLCHCRRNCSSQGLQESTSLGHAVAWLL